MARSDVDESSNSSSAFETVKMVRDTDDTLSNGNTIHSGHFMVSCLTDDENDEDENSPSVKIEEIKGYNFKGASTEIKKSYHFLDKKNAAMVAGIDTDLSKLFQCMTLAYSGKLTSPKWKNFKGLKLTIKDKVRLNNIIWREWHAQFVLMRRPKICQFEPPISDRTHAKPEAIVLEGKYWKRKLNSVTSEYMKWRTFYKKLRNFRPEDKGLMEQVASHAELLERVGQTAPVFRFGQTPNIRHSPNPNDFMEEDLMDLSDTLFSTLEKTTFAFPTHRELSQLGNADIIQPGLIGLQPSLDEYMDTLEPLPSLQEMMGASRSHRTSTITPSMLVDPIADPFFNDSSGSLSGVDFLSAANNSPLSTLLLENQPGLSGHQSPGGLNTQSGLTLGPQQHELSLNQHQSQTASFSQPQPRVRFTLDDQSSPPPHLLAPHHTVQDLSGLSAQTSVLTNADFTDNLSAVPLSQIQQLQHQPVQQPNSQQFIAANSSQQQTVAGLNLSNIQNTAGQITALTTSAQSTNQRNQNAAAQLLSLILEHGLGAPAVTSPSINSGNLNSLLASLKQQANNSTPVSPNNASLNGTLQNLTNTNTGFGNANSPPSFVPISGLSQQQSNQLVNSSLGQLLKQEDSAGSVAGVLKTGVRSDTALVQVQQQQVQQQVKQARAPQAQSASQLHTLLQGINQPTAPLLKRNSDNQINTGHQHSVAHQSHGHQRHRSGDTGARVGRGRGRPRNDEVRRASTGSVTQPNAKALLQQKQQQLQGFKVPENPARYKQVKIAPAPALAPKPTGIAQPQISVVSPLIKPAPGTSGHVNQLSIQPAAPAAQRISGAPGAVTVASAAKSVTQSTFLAQLLQGQDTAVPSIALKSETTTLGNYAVIQPKLVTTATTQPSIATTQPGMAFSIATANGLLLSNQTSTLSMAELLSADSPKPVGMGVDGDFRVPSPVGSIESGTRSRHASSESVGSPALVTSIKEEKVPSPGRAAYTRRKADLDPVAYKEHRRASHISAEQKRRFNIKYGFDTLCHLVPSLNNSPNAKVSKAAILQKAAEYARKLKAERARMQEEADVLKREIESLNNSIGKCQSQLPATGVPVSGQRVDRMKAMFEEYVRNRTLSNWKYWIFSMIVIGMHTAENAIGNRSSLFDTYSNTVSTASMEEFCRTVLSWLDQHCSLIALRPAVLPSLTRLSTSTSILTDPAKVPEEATKAVLDMHRRDSGTEIN